MSNSWKRQDKKFPKIFKLKENWKAASFSYKVPRMPTPELHADFKENTRLF